MNGYSLVAGNRQELHMQTRRNLWALLFFLLASELAYRGRHLPFVELVPEGMRPLFGAPPPVALITTALFVYVFATLVLVAYRLLQSQAPTWKHRDLGLRTVFFVLYLLAGALGSHFQGVLIAGLLLFALEQFHGWCYTLDGRCCPTQR
jgi:hypothetical protein